MTVRRPAYILSGGRSRRFGSDKARAELGGAPLLRRLANMLTPHVDRITVVADTPDKYRDLGLATITDRVPDLGPLGGLDAALRDLRDGEDWLLLTSCDLVAIRPAWIDELRAHASAGASCVAYRGHRWEPLLAMYHRSIAGLVDEHIQSRRRAMRDLLDAALAHALPLPADWPRITQVNTPADLTAAVKNIGVQR